MVEATPPDRDQALKRRHLEEVADRLGSQSFDCLAAWMTLKNGKGDKSISSDSRGYEYMRHRIDWCDECLSSCALKILHPRSRFHPPKVRLICANPKCRKVSVYPIVHLAATGHPRTSPDDESSTQPITLQEHQVDPDAPSQSDHSPRHARIDPCEPSKKPPSGHLKKKKSKSSRSALANLLESRRKETTTGSTDPNQKASGSNHSLHDFLTLL